MSDTASIQDRAEMIGYFITMSDNAQELLRITRVQGEDRKFWEKRAEMCDRAVKTLVDVK